MATFPVSPTSTNLPYSSAFHSENPTIPVPQLPYPVSPYENNVSDLSASVLPPPYHTVVSGGSDQGPFPAISPPPYPLSSCVSSDSKFDGNLPPPPPPGFYESSDLKTTEICPVPQLPYLPRGPTERNNLEVPVDRLEFAQDSDLDENESVSAPPLSSIEAVPGYEHVAFDYAILTPPAPCEWPEGPPDRQDAPCLHQYSKEEVESAVRHYAVEHCCYGDGVAKAMEVTEIVMSSVYHYILETFGEKRESAWCFEPYRGQPIDSSENGRAPGPWEVVVHPKGYYRDSKTKVEVPHTAFVKSCHGCNSRGRVRCSACTGRGHRTCNRCHGRRRVNNRSCTSCHSSGRKRCFRCHGSGRVKCRKCDGKGKLKGYLELSVTWKNHFDDYVSETPLVPKRKIRKVSGQIAFQEKKPKVWPMVHCADQHVNEASSNLIARHSTEFPNERILEQRHSLQIVPVGHCRYSWKNKTGDFCVYGFQKKVYFPGYPQKCCCCVIL